jgi:prepilin-type N-terminal cleavage/methylation domain-containing protein
MNCIKGRMQRANRFRRKNAFTLLEVMLVSAISLILITLSVPLFKKTYKDMEIASCAKGISQIIYFSRERAIFERRDYRVVIDEENSLYRILALDRESGLFRPLTDRWGRTFRVPEDIKIRTEAGRIDFSPGGESVSTVIYISRGDRIYSIVLDGCTGSVRLYDKTE